MLFMSDQYRYFLDSLFSHSLRPIGDMRGPPFCVLFPSIVKFDTVTDRGRPGMMRNASYKKVTLGDTLPQMKK